MPSEYFEIVDENDEVIGKALRSDCHGNPSLIHRTAHVVVYGSDGRILLQKRSMSKDIQPGKWDTAVGGHLDPGENYLQAAVREMSEELGVEAPADQLELLFDSRTRNDVESENVRVYQITHDGPFKPLECEIDELRFWTVEQLQNAIGTGVLTPSLEAELKQLGIV